LGTAGGNSWSKIMTKPNRTRFYSGGPWELTVGYSRATRAGDQIFVSGCTAMKNGQVAGKGDPAAQARQTLETIREALAGLGSSLYDVVRYRIYLTRIADWEAVAPVMAEAFGNVHPSGTLVAVTALIDPELLIEIEVDAIAGSAAPVEQRYTQAQNDRF
jgi:enamine deaminase RidA (YjgF/YER057c/UK114 family)